METFKIFVVEDDFLYAKVLSYHLSQNPDYEVTVFNSGKELLANLYKGVSAISLDYNLPDMSGIEFCTIAKSRHAGLKILAITSIEQRHVVDQMLAAGANGFILKSSDTSEILEAIKQILSGNTYISQSVADLLKGKLAANGNMPLLTRREVEVLKLIADGPFE